MIFPTRIRTKAEALTLAAELFPNHPAALAEAKRTHPGDDFPFYWVEQQTRENLQALFEWLYADKTRIYKRPRWHLFYELAARLIRLANTNRDATQSHWDDQHARRKYERRQRAYIFTGDGEGI